jgi:hypothetical protein
MVKCNICHCQLDRDDWEQTGGVCGSCVRGLTSQGWDGHSNQAPDLLERVNQLQAAINKHCETCVANIPQFKHECTDRCSLWEVKEEK